MHCSSHSLNVAVLLNEIFASLDHLLIITDLEGKIISKNKKASQLLDEKGLKDLISDVLFSTKNSEEILKFYQNNQLKINWKKFSYTDSQEEYFVLVGEDITELEALKEREYTLSYIIKKVPGFVFWKNKALSLIGCNENFAKQVGLNSSNDIIGKSDYELPWDAKQTEKFLKDDTEILNTGISKINIEETQKQLNGQDATLLTSKVPLYDKKGNISGVLGIYMDITEHKENQAALQKAKGQIDGMTLISASIAHELRTPLATIKLAAENIKRYLPKLVASYQAAKENHLTIPKLHPDCPKMLKDAADRIDKLVNHANLTINMLLTNLTFNQNQNSGFFECSIADCVNQALEKYNFNSHERKLVHVNIESDFKFYGKAVLIVHILFNLFKNAFYFIRKAQRGEIFISAKSSAEGNLLYFKDTSEGIPEDILPHIFKQFFSKDTNHGTGIGLAFSQMVMKAHNGNMDCRSQLGEFTEFILSFP